MRKHYVTFYSPGTFFPEESTKPISKWDTTEAVHLSKTIIERYNALPHSFRFRTMLEAEPVPDGEGGELQVAPKEAESSGLYYLGGVLRDYDEVKQKNDDKEKILLSNMKCNRMWVIIENTNSWRFTGEFSENDCIVDEQGKVVKRGDSPDLVHYRWLKSEEKDQGNL